jgi:glycosyltransferase involved in cell wall biosynthesis
MISIIHPTRGRLKEPLEAYDHWMDQASHSIPMEYILVMDTDDPVSNILPKKFSSRKLFRGIDIIFNPGGLFTFVEAVNRGYRASKGDIIVIVCDDLRAPRNWDKLISERTPIDKPAILGVAGPVVKSLDSVQPYSGDGLLTMMIGNRAWANQAHEDRFLYFDYWSMFVDNDFTQKAMMDDVLIDAWDLVFPHVWHGGDDDPLRDETHKRHAGEAAYEHGKTVYAYREYFGFPNMTKEKQKKDDIHGSFQEACYLNEYDEAARRLRPLIQKYHKIYANGQMVFFSAFTYWNELKKKGVQGLEPWTDAYKPFGE